MPPSFTAIIHASALDVSGLPPHARQPGTPAFKQGVSAMLAGDLQAALELAKAGERNLDLNDVTPKHRLKSFPGTFSGMKIVSYIYAAFQQFMPGVDVGIDLPKEYAAVKYGYQSFQLQLL
jgi:hypothetical protein